ncbi:YIP1 family protein [Paenibacillus sp. y28]|uniref:YIP1 family protein n=1 Tax=Paenibacillus sp. y28 TaxID=3129110 RepID=UPI0030164CBF
MRFSMRRHKRIWASLLALPLLLALAPAALAYMPYVTNYKDAYGRLVWTQAAYTPVDAVGGDLFLPDPKEPGKLAYSPLSQPRDLFIDSRNHLYIADTGNNRIVHLDENGGFVSAIVPDSGTLNKPEGVFVDRAGALYVADTGNKRVLRMDESGIVQQEYKRPESRLIPESFKYDPIKVAVDKRGFLYITTLGGYQGLLQLDPEGEFQGFFGANKAEFTAMDAIKRLLYTREMYAREISKLPGSASSVHIDQNGFIYTVTQHVETGQIKKLNMAGKDLLASKSEYADEEATEKSYGEIRFKPKDKTKVPALSDVTVDADGNMTAIDSALKYISQYDAGGNLLFFWAGDASPNAKLGLVKTPSAIANNAEGDLFILDQENGIVQRFRLSEFGSLVHQANRLTQDGRYEESEKLWEEVLRLNGGYTPAILGLAKAAYKKGEYPRAQRLFYEAGHQPGYSDAFWQVRLLWFQRHFGLLMNVFIGAAVLIFLSDRLTRRTAWRRQWKQRKRSAHPFIVQVRHLFYLLKHPLDGFSAIRYEQKGGGWMSLLLFILGLISFAVMRAFTDFTFNTDAIMDLSLITVSIQFMVIWIGWIVSNYLISSIYRGEGRFRDVVYGTSYAMLPLALVGLPLTLLSHGLTLSEAAVFHFLQAGVFIWVGVLLFWKVQSLQNYSVGEASMNLFLSLTTMTLLGVLVFITFGLTSELQDFVYSIYQEVTIR